MWQCHISDCCQPSISGAGVMAADNDAVSVRTAAEQAFEYIAASDENRIIGRIF